jgi:hypothetical protein
MLDVYDAEDSESSRTGVDNETELVETIPVNDHGFEAEAIGFVGKRLVKKMRVASLR